MRNLKRVLSLALALVMVLGMMVIGTSAATFTDADEITYEEAIAVMSGVGLYEGNPDGSLAPKQVLTREMAATIITRIMLGKKMASALTPTEQIFSDVATDRWSAAAIEYCHNIGMIDGYNGAFNPEGELTGVAFAKLLLCALGYDAAAEGYTGGDWAENIKADALVEGLYIEDVKITDKLTREGAAQMVLQVLEQKTVRYVTSYDYSTQANVVTGPWDNANTFAEKYFPTLVKDETVGAYDDMWGRPAEYAWVYGKVPAVLWTEWEEAAGKYTAAVSDCQIATDMGLKKDATIALYTNGVKSADYIDVDFVAPSNGAQGAQLEVYSDRVVRIDTYLAKVDGVVTELKDAAGHLVRAAKNEFDVYGLVDADAAIAGNKYAKNDMILVNYNAAKDVYVDLGVAESFVGAQTFIWWAANKHTVAGVEYNDACQMVLDEANIDLAASYTWYKDQFGNIIGVSKINTPKTYGIVEGVQWVNTWGINGYAQANVRYMDGTTGTVKVSYVGTNPVAYADYTDLNFDGTDNDFAAGKVSTVWQYNDDCMKDLYLFTKNIDGSYTLTAQKELTAATIADGVSAITGTGTPNYVFTDNYTVYMIQSQNPVTKAYTYTMVTGYDNLETKWTASATVDYVMNTPDTGYAKYVYITGASDKASLAGSQFVYFTSNTRYYGDALQNNVPCFVIGGVVRPDGTTDALYVKKTAEGTELETMTALSAFLATAKDKLYVVKTVNGIIEDLDAQAVVTTGSYDKDVLPSTYAFFANKSTFSTIDGNGVLMIGDKAYNINTATTIINKGGKGTITDLSEAILAGKSVYVVAKCAYVGTTKYDTAQVATIFITDTAIVAPTPANPATGKDAKVVSAVSGGTYYFDTLAAAIAAATDGDVITLLDNVTLTAQVTVPAGVTLDGAGFTVTYAGGNASAIVLAGETTLKNITVKGNSMLNLWESKYGVQAYDCADVVIENVVISGFDAAMLVNGAAVTLKGAINVSGNEFGGIEVSKGSAANTASLTVSGTVTNTTEKYLAPTAWTICDSGAANAQGTITGATWHSVFYEKVAGTSYQILFYMDAANTVAPTV